MATAPGTSWVAKTRLPVVSFSSVPAGGIATANLGAKHQVSLGKICAKLPGHVLLLAMQTHHLPLVAALGMGPYVAEHSGARRAFAPDGAGCSPACQPLGVTRGIASSGPGSPGGARSRPRSAGACRCPRRPAFGRGLVSRACLWSHRASWRMISAGRWSGVCLTTGSSHGKK